MVMRFGGPAKPSHVKFENDRLGREPNANNVVTRPSTPQLANPVILFLPLEHVRPKGSLKHPIISIGGFKRVFISASF